jgi:guanine deaminase
MQDGAKDRLRLPVATVSRQRHRKSPLDDLTRMKGIMIEPAELMRKATMACQAGIVAGQTPFGCAIAIGDRLLAVAHNTVLATTDITAHAEINALREACLATGDIFLESAVVASTCEPCPMCMAALHWARVKTVYFGATIDAAAAAGFNELRIPAADIVRLGASPVELVPGVLAAECQALFRTWQENPQARAY